MLKKYFDYLLYSLLCISVCMLFLPCGMFKNEFYSSSFYIGFQFIFKKQIDGFTIWNFNIIGLIFLILLLIIIVLILFEKKIKSCQYIIGVILLINSIFYLLTGFTIHFVQEEMKQDFILLFPFYLGFILYVLTGFIYLFKKQIKSKIK